MDVNEIRLRKTRQLARQLTGNRESGFREISEKMGWSQSLTSQLLGASAKRKITDSRARDIEVKFGKPHGWLDQSAEAVATEAEVDEQLLLQCLQDVRDEIASLDLNLTPDDADKLQVRATIVLYKLRKELGDLATARAALSAARL